MAVTDPLNTDPAKVGLINAGSMNTALSQGTTATGDKFNQISAPTQNTFGYNAGQRTVDPAKETVAGQFNALTQSDNPLITMGRTMAKQEMNKKGLLNSSMAIGAADAAAYQTALPIAQADAKTYSDNADRNLAYTNDALKTNTGSLNDSAKMNMSAAMEASKSNLDAANKMSLANIQSSYETLIQANQSASDMYAKTMQNITDISMSADLDATAKTNAINTQLAMLDTSLQMVGKMNDLGLGDLLNFNYNAGNGTVANYGTAG